jgi:hypothetical protein
MVVHRPELLARRHLRVERDLLEELVRGQAGVVGAEGARVVNEQSLSLCLHGRIR